MIGFSYTYTVPEEILTVRSATELGILIVIMVLVSVCIIVIFPLITITYKNIQATQSKRMKKRMLNQILIQKEIESEIEQEIKVGETGATT